MIESVIAGILRMANYSKKDKCEMEKGLSIHPPTKEETIYQSSMKGELSKIIRQRKSISCNCEYRKSPPQECFRKALAFEPSSNSHLKAEGNLEQVGWSTMPMKGIIALRRNHPSEKESIRFSRQCFEGAKSRDKFPSLNVIQTEKYKREISRCTTV